MNDSSDDKEEKQEPLKAAKVPFQRPLTRLENFDLEKSLPDAEYNQGIRDQSPGKIRRFREFIESERGEARSSTGKGKSDKKAE